MKMQYCMVVICIKSFHKLQKDVGRRWNESIEKLQGGLYPRRDVDHQLCYTKSSKIASGSEGSQIYLGLFEQQPVAVKRIDKEHLNGEYELSKVIAERQMCHVLPLLSCKTDEDFAYLVSPLCEYNLKEIIEDESCPWKAELSHERRFAMCLQFLYALKELHDASIVHRDLKPSNILLGELISRKK